MPPFLTNFCLFVCFRDEGLCVAQAGLELLASSHPPALAFQIVRITGASNCAWPQVFICLLVGFALFCFVLFLTGSGSVSQTGV